MAGSRCDATRAEDQDALLVGVLAIKGGSRERTDNRGLRYFFIVGLLAKKVFIPLYPLYVLFFGR